MWCNGIILMTCFIFIISRLNHICLSIHILSIWIPGLVCGPSVLFLTYIQGDLKKAIEFPYLYSPGFQVQISQNHGHHWSYLCNIYPPFICNVFRHLKIPALLDAPFFLKKKNTIMPVHFSGGVTHPTSVILQKAINIIWCYSDCRRCCYSHAC